MCSQRPIAKEQVKQEKEVQTARRLFREANERLQQAVKENNIYRDVSCFCSYGGSPKENR